MARPTKKTSRPEGTHSIRSFKADRDWAQQGDMPLPDDPMSSHGMGEEDALSLFGCSFPIPMELLTLQHSFSGIGSLFWSPETGMLGYESPTGDMQAFNFDVGSWEHIELHSRFDGTVRGRG